MQVRGRRAMTLDHTIAAAKAIYIFYWAVIICMALSRHVPKRTVVIDAAVALYAVSWPLFVVPAVIAWIAGIMAKRHG